MADAPLLHERRLRRDARRRADDLAVEDQRDLAARLLRVGSHEAGDVDRKCASAVVDKRGKAGNVIYAQVEATTISVFWFRRHHAAVAQKLACMPCDDELLASVLD